MGQTRKILHLIAALITSELLCSWTCLLSSIIKNYSLPPSHEDGSRSSFQNAVISSFYNTGQKAKSENPEISNVMHHRQNPSGYICIVLMLLSFCSITRSCHIFLPGPLSLVSTIEELLGRNSSGSGLEIGEYGRVDPLPSPRDTLCQQNLAPTSPTSGSRSADIVRSRTKATEFVCV
jgi:hypothetical protein